MLLKRFFLLLFFVTLLGNQSYIFARDAKQQTEGTSKHLQRVEIFGKYCPCYQTHSLHEQNSDVTRAIIIIHGAKRRPDAYFAQLLSVVKDEEKLKSTAVFAPHMQALEDKPKEDEYYWDSKNDGNWKDGNYSANKGKRGRLSSFGVATHLLTALSEGEIPFPNLKSVILVGHSAGGQYVNRFASAIPLKAHETAIVMNPSTYLYMDGRRKLPTGEFSIPEAAPKGYNDYKLGLDNLNEFMVRLGRENISRTMFSNRVYYFAGTDDIESRMLDQRPSANTQGPNRYERWKIYRDYVKTFPAWEVNTSFESIPGVGHSNLGMLSSPQLRAVLFSPPKGRQGMKDRVQMTVENPLASHTDK